ncbi:hypothetical protein NOF04DRAFT_10075 [Fusarium oxysporum II5]|uniref:Uncharacterized protein n=2 Tax=Fusarium oxysporum species complex TaxID=171631 RepID=X0JIN2_FUSO5|nr:uncharacterized protein FOIG_11727 [Fusarium odoratissimum NRRL 54006]EXL96180.1 hypothetical protein FOIG_11727 [Fusarium odoratissimum NRRL 54006]KAK2123952.1 hypothetical protein NOF04DRAFT_10075 [Fusarium oxysporum II5]TXB95587.1 hypothetical protein FocTR4_00016399 [Fusarium oxysporum f. sp. cubense]
MARRALTSQVSPSLSSHSFYSILLQGEEPKYNVSELARQNQHTIQEAPRLVSLVGTTELFINQQSDDYSTFARRRDKAVPLWGGPHRPLLRRLYYRCEQLREDRNASTVQGLFFRKLLERVASYDNSYLGIQSNTSRGLEVVADATMPAIMSQACSETAFGPPIFDNLLLVAELHASSLGSLADDIYLQL